jgi:hypothetical protein
MKIQLEKEVKWELGKSVTKYWILVDGKNVDLAYDEEKALELYENVKANYVGSRKEVIREDEI